MPTQKTGVVTKGGKKFLGYQVPPVIKVNGGELKYAGINENGVVMYRPDNGEWGKAGEFNEESNKL